MRIASRNSRATRAVVGVLASRYRRSPQLADGPGAQTVAFPAIATGVYGFPHDQAARIAVATLKATPTAVQQVRLVAFDEDIRERPQASALDSASLS